MYLLTLAVRHPKLPIALFHVPISIWLVGYLGHLREMIRLMKPLERSASLIPKSNITIFDSKLYINFVVYPIYRNKRTYIIVFITSGKAGDDVSCLIYSLSEVSRAQTWSASPTDIIRSFVEGFGGWTCIHTCPVKLFIR